MMTSTKAQRAQRRRFLLRRLVPIGVIDWALTTFPRLQRAQVVNYETLLDPERVEILLSRLLQACAFDGDVVECGTARAGSAVLMAHALRDAGRPKTIFACDAFAGFDRRELSAERGAGLTTVQDGTFTKTSLAYVERKLKAVGVSDLVQPVAGYFEETLPGLSNEFCFAFIDCDLRKSVTYCANQLWPQVTPGGQMVFDDYNDITFRGVSLAVNDFVAKNEATIAAHGDVGGSMYFVQKAVPAAQVGPG